MRFSGTVSLNVMLSRRRSIFEMRSLRSVAALRMMGVILLTACSSAPPPAITTQPAGAPPSEVSTITIPIRTTLAPLLPLLEAQVPKSMQKLDGYELDPQQRFGLKYKVVRDPIALNMQGTGLHATTTLHYQLEGCRRTTKPFSGEATMWPCLSCGFGEPMRDAFIAIDAHLDWDANWRLRSKTTARPVEFPNRCTVSFANIDISDWKLGPLMNEQLRDVTKTIDQNTPKLTSLKPVAGEIWSALQTPVEIAPKAWLVLEPVDLAVAPLTGSGLNVGSALTLTARTRLVIGEQPRVKALPLPAMRVSRDAGSGIRVPFDLELPYAEASRLMTEQFGAKKYKLASGELALDAIKLAPAHDGKLSIEATIDYRGGVMKRYRGVIVLEGTPRFDSAARLIVVDDLDYAIGSHKHNLFVRTADHLAHDSVRKAIADAASWSLDTQLAAIRSEIDKAITRPLAANVSLRGHVESIEPRVIDVHAGNITIRAIATGAAEVEVKRW